MTFGERIRIAREALGLSQAALAERAGVSQPTIFHWESAHGYKPRRDNLPRLAAALQVEPQWLEFGTGAGPEIRPAGGDFSPRDFDRKDPASYGAPAETQPTPPSSGELGKLLRVVAERAEAGNYDVAIRAAEAVVAMLKLRKAMAAGADTQRVSAE